MKLIVGLGNPGLRYAQTRHNIGSTVAQEIAKSHKAALRRDPGAQAVSGKLEVDAEAVILAVPLTYMNVSGLAVRSLMKKYAVRPDELLVVCDDLDLELGRIKVKQGGSSGGHRGIESIMDALKEQGFARLRIGIGRPHEEDAEVSDFVLAKFSRIERTAVKHAIDAASDCCLLWAQAGTTACMNKYNKKTDERK